MKKLLFLYPIEEYMRILGTDIETYDDLNETIDYRYRQKGYQVNFLTFKNKMITNVDLTLGDRVLELSKTFDGFITPVGIDDKEQNIYDYPSNEEINSLLGPTDDLVICGFHARDCVMRVAEYFNNKGINTMIDEDLTELFSMLSKRFYFDKANYNPKNKVVYDVSQDIWLNHKVLFTNSSYYKDLYKLPYYKLSKFKPTISIEDVIKRLEDNERQHQKRLIKKQSY